jgi:hypothetical protein
MTEPAALQTVPVHVTNAHEIHPAPRHEASHDIEINTRTFTLKTSQTGDPNDSVIQRILDRDPARTQAIVNVTSGTVYLCHTRAQAQAAAGDSSALGGAQEGALYAAGQYIPPLKTTDPLWAVISTDKAATGAQVSVIAERRRA